MIGLILLILAYIVIGVIFIAVGGIIGLILTAIALAIQALFYGAGVVIAVFVFLVFVYYFIREFIQ